MAGAPPRRYTGDIDAFFLHVKPTNGLDFHYRHNGNRAVRYRGSKVNRSILKNKTPPTASVARRARSSAGYYTNDNVRELDQKRNWGILPPRTNYKRIDQSRV
jgi:hypothetical protein